MIQPEPLFTPSLGLALRGEGGLPSPVLPGWTPKGGCGSLKAPAAFDRAPVRDPPQLPIAPLSHLALPQLLNGNWQLPATVNVRQASAQAPAAMDDRPAPPPVPQTGSASSLPLMVPADPAPAVDRTNGTPSALLAGSSPGETNASLPIAPPCAAASAEAATLTGVPQGGLVECKLMRPSTAGGAATSGARPSSSGGDSGDAIDGLCGDEASDHRLSLEFLETNGYFDMPIQQAAAELRVGVTTLKKVCRVNNIGRWPFRKRSSLNRLIEKTREYFSADPEQCAEALAQLEAQRSVLRAQQGEDIPDQVKRYRQSIFKLDYKVKKIVKERRTHRGPAIAACDKAQVARQLGVGTPANAILGILCHGDASTEPHPGLDEMDMSEMED